jgi:hypothetical protein
MGFAPSGDYWRALRRISSAYLFSPRSVSATAPRRVAIGERMLRDLSAAATGGGGGGEVVMRRVLHAASLDHVMATVFGARYDADSAEGAELEEMVKEGYDLLGLFNWGDHLPLLRWLDLQGVRRRCRSLVSRVNVFVARIIEEHRQKKKDDAANGESAAGDFVDVLLGLEGEEKLSDSDMIAVLWVRNKQTLLRYQEQQLLNCDLHEYCICNIDFDQLRNASCVSFVSSKNLFLQTINIIHKTHRR